MDKKYIDLSRSVYALCTENPELPDIMRELGFTEITLPGMLSTVGRVMTIPKGAAMRKIPLNDVVDRLRQKGFEVKES